jgi:hypothetical protein
MWNEWFIAENAEKPSPMMLLIVEGAEKESFMSQD